MYQEKREFTHLILTTTLLDGYYLNLHSTDEKTALRSYGTCLESHSHKANNQFQVKYLQCLSSKPPSHSASKKAEL